MSVQEQEGIQTCTNALLMRDWLRNCPQGDEVVQAEYIWIGGSGKDIRGKTKSLVRPSLPIKVEDLPDWNFDGSSTGQAPGDDSEVILKPRVVFPDPFRGSPNVIVLCDTWDPQGNPLPTNTRYPAVKVFEKVKDHECWYGLEQEYTLFTKDKWPLGWPRNGYPGPQGPYYCSCGFENTFGRHLVEVHYRCCLHAGLKISGINGEVMPGQWEYQIGPCTGIEAGDHMTMARYFMHRVGEQFGIIVSIEPKPIPGDWNGAGCHVNYSTKSMRQEGGFDVIMDAIKKLEKHHFEHIEVYGEGNEERLTGAHETAPIDKFTYGVANRGASVRIPRTTEAEKKGYFEDRRPASNIDPYVVSSMIAETTLLK